MNEGVLFVPVSGPVGSGEYQRCLMLANALARRGVAPLRFVVSAQAAYADRVPYPTFSVDGSTTRAAIAVAGEIERRRPAVVVFDSGGRAATWRAARAAGARVAYVSSRPSSLARGLRWRRLGNLDLHWHVAPRALTPTAGPWTALKRRLLPQARFERVDVWFEAPAVDRPIALPRPFVLCVAGGGAQRTGDGDADALFSKLAADLARVAASLGMDCVHVGRGVAAAGVHATGALSNADLMALARDAALVVCGAGNLLVQVLTLHTPVLACALQDEQRPRLDWAASRGAAAASVADRQALFATATELLGDPGRRSALAEAARGLALLNGLDAAVERLACLAQVSGRTVE